MPRIAVIADDLTGAMDSGLQFGKRGLETLVPISWEHVPEGEVAVIDTETREAPATTAHRRLCAVAERLRAEHVYKKVDSTMRGNVGYELRALADILQPRGIVIAPAFPGIGRTTVHGRQHVDGRALELTFFGHDPRWPMRESHLPTLLMEQAGAEVGLAGLDVVDAGRDALMRRLSACGESYVVVDAVLDHHLATIAEAVVGLQGEWLPCGSAGLAAAWADALALDSESPPRVRPHDARPVLVIAGSRNDATRRQLTYATDALALPRVDLDVNHLWTLDAEVARMAESATRTLLTGQDVAISATCSPLAAGRESTVADLLARVAARVAADVDLGGLFVTGGEVSIAVCRALGVEALRILDEVQIGVPGGLLIGGEYDGLKVVTKAGGFGDDSVLVDALAYLHDLPVSAPTC